ncbi:branched-chain amino acid ABC transporter permease [Neomegalonema sp.]|uniref:branched-chain amino acid ABC transporter permease n=1 Tax=Neomegalonema sp. TaxID=2039713 RepID=UPI00262B24FE|nr:branched-chain amino acid ABC transporter permease [Neomegalonema sp.]MDD2868591.1 branched-chain amino acid ABC transporter permease [Neomegalonema sp.]
MKSLSSASPREAAANLAILALLILGPWAALSAGHPFYVTLATKAAILALAATGLHLALGLGGLVSFGHAAFFGLGGYAAGILAAHAGSGEALILGWAGSREILTMILAAMGLALLAALPIGAISLRTSGVYFLMITLAFAQMIYYFALSWPAYGGDDGLSFRRGIFPGLNSARPLPYFWICLGALLIGLALFQILRASRFGTALEATRQNPQRVEALGIEPFGLRLTAFALSAMMVGAAGALFANLNRFASPSMLSWQMSGELIVLILLGGRGRLLGPTAGAVLFVAMEHVLGGWTERWQFFLGLAVLGVAVFARGGLLGLIAGGRRDG